MRFAGGHALDDTNGDPVKGTGGQGFPNPEGLRGKASELAPLGFTSDQLQAMHAAMSSKSSYAIKTKAYFTVDALLPPDLQPSVVGPQYEGRLLDHLPIFPTNAPSIEYIRHTSTTGAPAITAEGAQKPELVFVTDSIVVAAQKIAAHAAISWESMTDYDAFTSYFTDELQRQVVNVENDELLNGAGPPASAGREDIMKIIMREPVQVVHDGVVYGPGETAEVPNASGQFWIRSEWSDEAEEAEVQDRPAAKTLPRK